MACRCWNGNEMNGRWGVSIHLIEIQWQKWPKLSKALLQIAASKASPCFSSSSSHFFITVSESLFLLSLFHVFSLSSLLLYPHRWNGFRNEISQITIFQTTAWCFLHTRCYHSNRAIIHPSAVLYRSCCMNLAWHMRPGISFMLSVPALMDWCNCLGLVLQRNWEFVFLMLNSGEGLLWRVLVAHVMWVVDDVRMSHYTRVDSA